QNQIPFFVDRKFGLLLKDFKDKDSILQVLNEELIIWTCQQFGIQRESLEGTKNQIYAGKDYYKRINLFIRALCNLIDNGR
ncbi:hypothetical protein R0K18_34410, partial [Pantoea sp. SIMBA_133]